MQFATEAERRYAHYYNYQCMLMFCAILAAVPLLCYTRSIQFFAFAVILSLALRGIRYWYKRFVPHPDSHIPDYQDQKRQPSFFKRVYVAVLATALFWSVFLALEGLALLIVPELLVLGAILLVMMFRSIHPHLNLKR